MANLPTSTTLARWNSATRVLEHLNRQLSSCTAEERTRLSDAVGEAEEILLDLNAPHLTAVLQKLYLLFDVDLNKVDQDGEAKRCIIADLRRLIGMDG